MYLIPILFDRKFINVSFHLRNFDDFLKLGSCNVAVSEKLRNSSSHCKVHIQLPFALFQRKLTTAKESHNTLFI